MSTLQFFLERVASPLGEMLIITDERARLRALDWHDHEERMHLLMRRQYPGKRMKLGEASAASPA